MKLKNIKVKDVIKILEDNGFKIKRQTGTHLIMRNNGQMVVVPVHNKTIPVGTFKSIEKQSGVDIRESLEK